MAGTNAPDLRVVGQQEGVPEDLVGGVPGDPRRQVGHHGRRLREDLALAGGVGRREAGRVGRLPAPPVHADGARDLPQGARGARLQREPPLQGEVRGGRVRRVADRGEGPLAQAPMRNPLEATGLLREGQAVELFNRRDYGAAALVFGDIVGKVSGVEREHYYRGLLLLSEGYAAWDVADYGVALERLREARGELGVGFSELDLAVRAGPLVDRISVHLSFLGKVRGRLSAENVVDMLENARRRIKDQGRHDDGVARLYRTVEMWHQWRLSQHSISTAAVEWERVDEEIRGRFLAETGLEEPPQVLALYHARILDRILDGGAPEEDTLLSDLLQKRNHSILAHGLEPMNGKAAARFLKYVDDMVDVPEARIGAEHATLRGL
jgi:CRISPR-associated protein (TIGR02710 family)